MSEADDQSFRRDIRARSPWAALTHVDSMIVHPVQAFSQHQLQIPGSKSFTNRAVLLAGAASGPSVLRGILKSDDAYWCIDTLRRLGLRVEVEGDIVRIDAHGGIYPNKTGELYVGASGTVSRFLPGLLTAAGGEWIIDGSERLRERPMQPLLDGLTELGADIVYLGETGFLPVKISGSRLRGGHVAISGSVSSQFISGLLMAAPLCDEDVTIEIVDQSVQPAYIGITIQLMKTFGVEVHHDVNWLKFEVSPTSYAGVDTTLEADASTAGYFFALAAATGQAITVSNLNHNTLQPDIELLDILEQLGCKVQRSVQGITVCGPQGKLRGNRTVSMHACSDQALTLAAIAPFADGPIAVRDVGHIRAHECDRIKAACENLERAGIRAEEHADGFTVHPGTPKFARLPSYDDHRVAMAFSVFGAARAGVEMGDPGAVSKTCPQFFELLGQLGVQCNHGV